MPDPQTVQVTIFKGADRTPLRTISVREDDLNDFEDDAADNAIDYEILEAAPAAADAPKVIEMDTQVIEGDPAGPGMSMDINTSQAEWAGEEQLERESKKFQRAANTMLDQRPATFFPGKPMPQTPTGGLLGIGGRSEQVNTGAPAGSVLDSHVYKHFEPSLDDAIDALRAAGADAEDIAALEAGEKESAQYRGYAETLYRQVYDAHEKHGLPVARIEKLPDADIEHMVARDALAPVGRAAAGFGVTADLFSVFGAGREAMGRARDELIASPAEEDLIAAGIIKPFEDRIGEIGSETKAAMAGQVAGGIVGLSTPIPGKVAGLAARVGEKVGEKIGGVVAGGIAEGMVAGTAEAVGEEGVSAIANTMSGKPVEAEDITSRVLLSGATGGLARKAEKAMGGFQKMLRREDAGDTEKNLLNQMEELTGERGTSVFNRAGVKPSVDHYEVIAADGTSKYFATHRAAARYAREKGGAPWPIQGPSDVADRTAAMRKKYRGMGAEFRSIESRFGKLSKPVLDEIEAERDRVKIPIFEESEAFYESPAGQQMVDVRGVTARLEVMKDNLMGTAAKAKPGIVMEGLEVSPSTASATGRRPAGASKESVLPGAEIGVLKELIKRFKANPKMNARGVDETLSALDAAVAKEPADAAAAKFRKEASGMLHEIRSAFGPEFVAMRERHDGMVKGLRQLEDVTGLQFGQKLDVDIPSQASILVAALKKYGHGDAVDPHLRKLTLKLPNKGRQLHEMLSHIPRRALRGEAGFKITKQGMADRLTSPSTYYRFDPIAEALEGAIGKAGAKPAMATGSEAASAVLAEGSEDIEILKKIKAFLYNEFEGENSPETTRSP